MGRPSAKRTYSIYLDDAENLAVNRVAAANHATPNAVCRALIRRALGLPALELRIPPEVQAWAERRSQVADADARLAG
jgi:hypothetical protein